MALGLFLLLYQILSAFGTPLQWLGACMIRTLLSICTNECPSRRISRIVSSTRVVADARVIDETRRKIENILPLESIHGRNEIDSHADTVVFGPNWIVLHYTARECDVSPYSEDYAAKTNIPIVTGASTWTDPESGLDYVLVIHEGLWMPDFVKHSLINPNQLRSFGTTVDDNPFAGPMSVASPDDEIRVPMSAAGTNIYFESRTPTQRELDECPHIHLTSEHPWDPHTIKFPNVSAVYRDSSVTEEYHGNPQDPDEIYNVDGFQRRLLASVRVKDIPRKVEASAVVRDVATPPTFYSKERRADVTPETLADRWLIGLETAKKTLKYTTQRFIRSALLPVSRRYKADRIYSLPQLQGEWFTDTVDGRVKSRDGNRYGQIFANEAYFATIYPMDAKQKAGDALRIFCQEFGIPETLRYDGSKEQKERGTEFQHQVRKHGIKTHMAEPELHNQSPAEGVVREVRRRWYRTMFRNRVPKIFWDYGMRWVCDTMSRTYTRGHRIDGGIPLQKVTGETVDISQYLEFAFYEHVNYQDNGGMSEVQVGRWLGIAKHVGGEMTYWILQSNLEIVARSTVWRITNLEKETDSMKTALKEYDEEVKRRLKENDFPEVDGDKPTPEAWADLVEGDEDFREEFFKVYQDSDIKEADDMPSPEIMDESFINMELALPRDGDGPEFARVKKRMRDSEGNPIGRASNNLAEDTRVFEVEFADGHTASMAANAISENLFAQVDQEGNRLLLMEDIVDYRSTNEALKAADAFTVSRDGKRKRRKATTKGWEFLVRWKDGAETWVCLKDMKDSYPVQVAEYAVEKRIHEEPAFAWWVPHTVRKRNAILSKVKSKYWQRTHKFGIRIPKSVAEAKKIDAENGNTLWWDSICTEMANVRIAFEEYEGPLTVDGKPKGYKPLTVHMVFDIKLGENYRRKSRLVADGHKTEAPPSLTYSSVVSRDSVRIAMLLASLNGCDILSCDIQNAYLTAPCREKYYVVAGPEFGSDQGKCMIVTRALYGLPSAGATFRAFLGEHLYEMSYRPSLADPDVWMRPAVKPNGEEYYEYILCYVDDIIAISMNPMDTMKAIQRKFKLKGDKAEPPEDYLGAQLSKMTTARGTTCWTQSSDKYVRESVKNVEAFLEKKGRKLPSRCVTPVKSGYRPELDATAELAIEGHRYYQEMIGVLRWAVEIGRLDILLEVSLLSQYLAAPREGHLEQVFHVFGYLKQNPKRKLAFDPDYPDIDESRFTKYDWYDFYRECKESIPPNMPPPRGKPVSIHCFVDANLAGNTVTRRSQTGILIFCNRAPVLFHSKKQLTVESSTFGSELVAMKNAIEMIEALRYKLRMFGVPLVGPADIFCDNEAVTKNCSIPESQLKKKHHSIAYHRNRMSVANGTCRIAKEDTDTNLSDLFTKLLPEERRNFLIDGFMY